MCRIIKVGLDHEVTLQKLSMDLDVALNGYVDLRDLIRRSSFLHLNFNNVQGFDVFRELSSAFHLPFPGIENVNIRDDDGDGDGVAAASASVIQLAVLSRSTVFQLYDYRLDEYDPCTVYKWCVPVQQTNSSKVVDMHHPRGRNTLQTRASDLYDNCLVLAPDGARLSYISRKRMQFYLRKNLAEPVSDPSPDDSAQPRYVIRLRFEPSGRPSERQPEPVLQRNVCVVCGSSEGLVRSYIVPHEYRRLFPASVKSHSSHDVMLQCKHCYSSFCQHHIRVRRDLAQQYQVPLDGSYEFKNVEPDPILCRAKKSAMALQRFGSQMPSSRRKQLELFVAEVDGSIEEVAAMDISVNRGKFSSHAELLLEKFAAEGGTLFHFVRLWRLRFVQALKPRFLGPNWSIDMLLNSDEGFQCNPI